MPNWKPEEVGLACKAFCIATQNGNIRPEQDMGAFSKALVAEFEKLSPKDCDDGTYYKRGMRVYKYLRDNVFQDILRFKEALKYVYLSKPDNCSKQEKINMAIAIHVGETEEMDYEYRMYNPYKWRFYIGYLQLKNISSSSFMSRFNKSGGGWKAVVAGMDDNLNGEDDYNFDDDDADENDTGGNGNTVSIVIPGGPRRPPEASRTITDSLETADKRKEPPTGLFPTAEEMQEHKKARFEQEKEKNETLKSIAASLKELQEGWKQQTASVILSAAIQTASDPDVKKKFEDKLIALAESL